MIQTKLVRRSLALAVGAALAVGSQFAIAATQQLGGNVTIDARDIETNFHRWLSFGAVKVGASGGTVSISNDGTSNTTVSGDVTSVVGGEEGSLGIKGEQNYTVTVILDETFTMSPVNVTASDLTVTTSGQGDVLTLTAANDSWNYFNIGGTLTVPANQPADAYRGLYNATVNYQ